MIDTIKKSWQQHLTVFNALEPLLPRILEVGQVCIEAIKQGGKIMWLGNGGSAADCQHLAAELVGRFDRKRQPLPSLALTTDSSVLTAVANDFGYEHIFTRQITALCRKEDVVCGISTSGQSANFVRGLQTVREIGATTVALIGAGKLSNVDYCLAVPSDDVPRIQECHIFIGHTLCEIIDAYFGDGAKHTCRKE